jgi:prolyl 4-hydroxylase
VNKNHPLLLLQPAREEEVYLDPWIVVYHNIVSDHEIETIKTLATPRVSERNLSKH